jgi:uncharacterized protein YcfJ
MNKPIALAAALAAVLALPQAATAGTYRDTATVLAVTPVYQRVAVPQEQCWTEPVTSYETRRVVHREPAYAREAGPGAGALLGAIVGGVIGHQFGNSSGGRDRATAAGAIVGGLIGHDAERDAGYARARYEDVRYPVTREARRCRTVESVRDEIAGYDVRYRYQGREFLTRLAYDPGPTLAVDVEARPAAPRPQPPAWSHAR